LSEAWPETFDFPEGGPPAVLPVQVTMRKHLCKKNKKFQGWLWFIWRGDRAIIKSYLA